jgi:hypothetical protein
LLGVISKFLYQQQRSAAAEEEKNIVAYAVSSYYSVVFIRISGYLLGIIPHFYRK